MPEIDQVISSGLCTGCGACEALCPYRAVTVREHPNGDLKCVNCYLIKKYGSNIPYSSAAVVGENCEDCYACQRVCPALSGFPEDEFDNALKVFSGKSKIEGQDGGVVSRIIESLLEQDYLDCVVSVVRDGKWKGSPILITDASDVKKVAGTKYTASPVLALLRDAMDEYERIAVVGTPCQAQAAERMRWEVTRNIRLIIGLFCMESFTYEDLCNRFITKELQVPLDTVKKMDFDKGKFVVYADEEHRVAIKDIAKFARSPCHHCLDFSSYYADISVGSVGSAPGWSTIIIRNGIGKKYFDLVDGIEIGEADLEFVGKLAGRKHKVNSS
ncbi:MAG: Coenzyme F420 hydrogenase/dehydrogenase, beta subunit C-terminal domain [Halobacteriota archaeon]|nr:Coenzyme F420 hydrogenase/dehydrogenase, beta subunit C-terminal domain [Halobacteriota archaeon]